LQDGVARALDVIVLVHVPCAVCAHRFGGLQRAKAGELLQTELQVRARLDLHAQSEHPARRAV
jgi:hypothetical protein